VLGGATPLGLGRFLLYHPIALSPDHMSFKDHFSGHAALYAKYRPDYPPELYAYLATLTPHRDIALDCATGSGQAAVGLANHFAMVVAADGSVAQLRNAQPNPRVAYVGNLAEQPAFRDGSIDLVTAAQAAHWFDHERFYPQVRRVLRPQGALAIWTYGIAVISPEIDAVMSDFYWREVGEYWPAERRYVEAAYRNMPFPFEEVAAPTWQLRLEWDLDAFIGYVSTWSAVQRYKKERGADPLSKLRERVEPVWNSGEKLRRVAWPLHLRVGRPG
jgi:ubiquinone/menaquinone biosynthesis C-methylase UbiE